MVHQTVYLWAPEGVNDPPPRLHVGTWDDEPLCDAWPTADFLTVTSWDVDELPLVSAVHQ